MAGNERFWYFFGGIWLFVGLAFLLGSLGIEVLGDDGSLEPDRAPLWVFTLVGLAMSVAGGLIITLAYKADAHDRHLMQIGVQHEAFVTDVRPSPVKINRETGWNVLYRYDYKGRSLEGKSRALFGVGAQDLKPGEKVQIMLDPAKPEDSLLLYS